MLAECVCAMPRDEAADESMYIGVTTLSKVIWIVLLAILVLGLLEWLLLAAISPST